MAIENQQPEQKDENIAKTRQPFPGADQAFGEMNFVWHKFRQATVSKIGRYFIFHRSISHHRKQQGKMNSSDE
jgi:hypothetical protein